MRHSNGYYEGCYDDIDEKWWSCGETMTLKEALDLWWNSVRIKVPGKKKSKIYTCYKCAYTDKNGPYELDGLPKSYLNKEIALNDEYDEDCDGHPIIGAEFINIKDVIKLQEVK